jgi:hypothetical protein
MAGGRRTGGRRGFLKGGVIASCAPLLDGAAAEEGAMCGPDVDREDVDRLAGIDPKNIVEEARARGLGALSDAALYRASGAIVSGPPRRGGSSFTLHAPLEVMARYGLLRLVDPSERELARLQIIASAAAYGARVDAMAPPARPKPFPDLTAASAEFARLFKQADADGMEALVLQVAAQFGTASLVDLLAPMTLPTLTGASHSHIGLWLLLRHGEAADVADASLLRAAARSLASNPGAQMKSFSGMAIEGDRPLDRAPERIEKEVLARLASPLEGKKLGNPGIAALVQAGEATGHADAFFGDFIRHDLSRAQVDAASRAVLRIAAHSMLQDAIDQAKFGWTHCLTLPQSACGLGSLNTQRKRALAASLVWITAYRSVLSRRALDLDWSPEKIGDVSLREALHTSPRAAAARVWHAREAELPGIRRALATEASIRNDIHLVKYTRATLDMGSFDPQYQRLYLAAAAHLAAVWIAEYPRERILDHLLSGRT